MLVIYVIKSIKFKRLPLITIYQNVYLKNNQLLYILKFIFLILIHLHDLPLIIFPSLILKCLAENKAIKILQVCHSILLTQSRCFCSSPHPLHFFYLRSINVSISVLAEGWRSVRGNNIEPYFHLHTSVLDRLIQHYVRAGTVGYVRGSKRIKCYSGLFRKENIYFITKVQESTAVSG